MRKLTSFLMLWLLCLSSSMQAQTTFNKPGERLDMTNDAVTVGSIAPAAVVSAITISPAPSNGAWASGTTWYKIKQKNSYYWSTNAAYTTSNGYIKLSNTETPTDARAMWCVTGNADDGFSFYNLAEGTSAKFATSGRAGGAVSHITTSPTDSEVTLFDILQSSGTTSFYIRDHGTANNFLNLRDGYLAHWDNPSGLGNDGSKIEFEPVSDEDLLAAATAAKTQMLERLTAWKNISAIDGISAIYNELNDNTARDAMGMLAAVRKAQTAFATAVNGKRVKLTICESSTSHNRYGRVLALDATQAHGKQPVQTADEIITLKANRDATVNLYNEYYNTYVAAPGTANAATAEVAGNFYLQINETSPVQNEAAFKTKANDMLHMSANGDCPLINHNNFDDGASRWTFAHINDADFAKLELSWAINEATATYNALSAYTSTSSEFITTPTTVLSTLNTAIEAARDALAVADDTKENYTTAKNMLATAVADAQKGFYAQFGDTKFRLKLKDTELYMQVNCPMSGSEGNARLAATSAGNPDQCFSLIAGADANEGKYFIQAQGKMLQDLSWWNSQMSSTGTAFTFEPVDLAAGEIKIKGSQGYYGTSASPEAGTIIYTNVGAGAKVTWVLEPIAKNDYRILLEADITPIQTWHKAYYEKIKDKTSAVFTAYNSAYNAALKNAEERNLNKVTSAEIVASHKALQPAYKAMTDALPEAAGQLFRLQLHSSDHGDNYFMEVINTNLKGVVVTQGPLTVPARTFTFAKQDDGFYVIKCGDNPLIYSTGNNYWDVQCATGEASKWQVTPDANVANRFLIRKVGESSTYLSPDNTLKEDGSYIVYSNWKTANTWELVPVADGDVTGYDEALLQRAETLYKKYLPYKGVYNALYDAEKENLPGYPQAASFYFDGHFSQLEEMLVKPSSITTDALNEFEAGVPYVLPVLEKYPTNRYFVIRNSSRGDMTYDTSAGSGETSDGETLTYVWSTGKEGATAFDPALANHQWCFMENPQAAGEYFLYNVGKKQYARPAKVSSNNNLPYTWVFSDEPAPVTLKWRSGHEMFVTAKSTSHPEDTKVYLSMSTGYSGPLISHADPGLTDEGLRFTFDWATPTEVDADVTSAVSALVQNDVALTTIGATSLITGLTGEQTTIRTFSSMKAFNVPEGVTAYIATTQIEGSTTFIDLQAVPAEEAVPAQQGVLLIGNKTQATLPVNYRPATGEFTWANNKFLSTATGGVPMTSGCYILANGADGIGIYASKEGTLSQGKAYLKLDGSAPSNRLVMRFNGVATSIENLLPALCGEQGAVYDLSGRRVNTVQKGGVYIQNGKKFIYK